MYISLVVCWPVLAPVQCSRVVVDGINGQAMVGAQSRCDHGPGHSDNIIVTPTIAMVSMTSDIIMSVRGCEAVVRCDTRDRLCAAWS